MQFWSPNLILKHFISSHRYYIGVPIFMAFPTNKAMEEQESVRPENGSRMENENTLHSESCNSRVIAHRNLDKANNCFTSKYSFQYSSSSLQSDSLSSRSMSSFQSQSSLHSTSSFMSRFAEFSGNGSLSNAYRCISKLKGHDGSVFCLALSGTNFLYTGSSNGKDIRVWQQHDHIEDPVKFFCKFGSSGNHGSVKSIIVIGDKIFSAYQDHKIRVWRRSDTNPAKHNLVCTMPTVKDYLRRFLKPENYTKVNRHSKCLWIEHIDTISALAAGANGLLYSASWDRTVRVWSSSDFRCLESFRAHEDAINAIVVSDEGFLYTASADSKIKVWMKSTGRRKHSLFNTLEKHRSAVNALALSPDGSILYSGGCDRAIMVWERHGKTAESHMCVAAGFLRGHVQPILCLATVSNLLCSGSADKTVRIWRREIDNPQTRCIAVLNGHNGPVKSITAYKDGFMGCVVYSGSLDGEIRTWLDPSEKDNPF